MCAVANATRPTSEARRHVWAIRGRSSGRRSRCTAQKAREGNLSPARQRHAPSKNFRRFCGGRKSRWKGPDLRRVSWPEGDSRGNPGQSSWGVVLEFGRRGSSGRGLRTGRTRLLPKREGTEPVTLKTVKNNLLQKVQSN